MRNQPTNRAAVGSLVALLSGFAPPIAAAPTPAGTVIVNLASVIHSSGSATVTTTSNQTATVVSGEPGLAVTKSVEPGGAVPPGTVVTFRFLVRNPANVPVHDMVMIDPLDLLLGPPTAISSGSVPDRSPAGGVIALTGAYISSTRTVRWDVPVIPPGSRFEISFQCQVLPGAPDDSSIRNITTQTSAQDPNGTSSNEVLVPVVAPALSISMQASRSRAEVGEPVGFTIDVSNISATLDLTGVEIREHLPKGFRYLEDSARLDRARIPDPSEAGGGRNLRFAIGDLPMGFSRRLTFITIPTPEAEERDGLNKAWVEALTPSGARVTAGPAEASVRIAGSLLTSDTVVVGRVFVDDNRNGQFDGGEVGVPSARVYLEDGTFSLTDVVGKYHIEGVRPGLHVIKVDGMTLPDGLGPFASWSRSAGGAGTQFLDAGDDQLFKSNIPTGGWGISVARLTARGFYRDAGVTAETEDLRQVVFPPLLASAVFVRDGVEMTRTARTVVEAYASLVRERGGRLVTLEVEPSYYPLGDEALMSSRAERLRSEMSRMLLASAPGGAEMPRTAGPGPGAGSPAERNNLDVTAASSRSSSPEIMALEAEVKELSPEPAVLTPAEGAALAGERANVEVKLPAGLEPRLQINGEVVANDTIAVRMETSLSHVVFYRYVGLPFKEGRNSLVLEGIDSWGNARAWVERIVLRVGQPSRVALRPDDGSLNADARTPIEVIIDVRDAEGLPVRDGTLVTVEVDEGNLLGSDASAQQEGFQIATSRGAARASLTPASRVGRRTVTASAGEAKGESTFTLTPELRRWVVAGVGEGTIGRRGATGGATFSEALGDQAGDARLALFARGRLFGSSLMTLSYDSDRERDRDQLFRRLAPDRFFPIYGDSSEQRYEVEGQGKFSLRLDQPRSTLTLGDFTTALSGGDLIRYDRALTGGAGRVELKGFSLQSFGATTPQTQIRDELAGAGTSGPYRLTRRPLVVNSERVMVETRDRFHAERLIGTRAMSRFADYDIDYEGGGIFFKQPVPFQDDDFNPIVVVVIYETLDGDGESTVAGGRAGYRFGETAEIGTTYVNEAREGGDFILQGADFRFGRNLGAGSVELRGEAATSESGSGDPAGAVSFRATGRVGRSVGLSGYYRNVSPGYENPSRAGLSDSGTVRWGFEGDAALADKSRLKGELFSQTDSLRGQDRRVGSLDWDKSIGKITTRTGFKDLSAIDPLSGESRASRLLSAGLAVRFTKRFEALFGRQQVVYGAALPEYPTRTTIGLTSQVTEDIRGFIREEYDQSDAGQASRTVVGMESRLTRNTVMESRYSLEDALNGSRGFAQLGLRTRLPLTRDWLGDASLERVETTRGLSGDFTALGIGFEYLPARVKFTTRYELRLGEADDAHVLTAAGATRVTEALSLFSRNRFFLVVPESGSTRFDGDGLLGLAYRPVSDDRLNFLVKLQGLKGSGVGGAGSPDSRSYLGIFETNYQPAARLHLLGRVAFKKSQDRFEGDSFLSDQRLLETRILYDIDDRFNAGVSARLLDQMTVGSRLTGYGIEGGYRLATDLWMVTGYNITGFTTMGFGDSDRRSAGPFLTVRFKFDEESLVGLSKSLSRAQPTPSE